MNKTKELLTKIIEAIETGHLQIDDFLSDDIGSCFIQEIDLALLLYKEEQQEEIKKRAARLAEKLKGSRDNAQLYISIIDSMILCIDLISEEKEWFVNVNHWRQVHGDNNPEINDIIKYIEKTGEVNAISSEFTDEYTNYDCPVYFDDNCGMHYVMHREKKMYFPKDYNAERVSEYYRGIVIEQDIRSPHCYYKDGYAVKHGDVVVDAGVAEGNFSLEHIDMASHIYLIEADESWIEALKETFKNYSNKVTIIKGYLSDEMDGEHVSIDGLFSDLLINYIKMDIEGYERLALLGSEGVIGKSNDIRCVICSYHKKGDEQWIREYMDGMLMENTTSKGYMIPTWDRSAYHDCEVRRGVVFGRKK